MAATTFAVFSGLRLTRMSMSAVARGSVEPPLSSYSLALPTYAAIRRFVSLVFR